MPTDPNPDPKYNKAMVVVAHPDDAEYGCSGTVAKWCREGWEVVYVLCTDGSKGSDDPEMTPERLAEIRYQEQEDAAKILGLKTVEYLNYPDALILQTDSYKCHKTFCPQTYRFAQPPNGCRNLLQVVTCRYNASPRWHSENKTIFH